MTLGRSSDTESTTLELSSISLFSLFVCSGLHRAHSGLELPVQPRMALNSWSSCVYLSSASTTAVSPSLKGRLVVNWQSVLGEAPGHLVARHRLCSHRAPWSCCAVDHGLQNIDCLADFEQLSIVGLFLE